MFVLANCQLHVVDAFSILWSSSYLRLWNKLHLHLLMYTQSRINWQTNTTKKKPCLPLCKRSLFFYKNAFNHKPCKQTPNIILTEIISAKCNFRVENISCLPVYDWLFLTAPFRVCCALVQETCWLAVSWLSQNLWHSCGKEVSWLPRFLSVPVIYLIFIFLKYEATLDPILLPNHQPLCKPSHSWTKQYGCSESL